MSENLGHSNSNIQAIHILSFFKKRGVYHIFGSAEGRGAIWHAHPYYVIYRVPPSEVLTIYGAGSVEKKIDLYNIHVHNPEGCYFMVYPDLVRSV